jgi:NADPH:quinone reductase-like Zn-dependent oxidoreductase
MKGTLLSLLSYLAAASTLLSPDAAMQAAVITPGTAPQIHVQTVPKPDPQLGQVRIKVRAASVNPVDWKIADRAAPGSRLIAGRDLSGVIDAVGASAGPWKPGDAVIAIAAGGSYAEYALASTSAIAAKPARMSFEEAAGIPVVGETAWRSMITVANVQSGQRVLIHGGAGGVGSSAVQIAKARGAYVIATASASHAELVRSFGADEIIDYHNVRFEEKVRNVDVVLNTVDAETGTRSIGVIKPGGILVSVVGPTDAAACAAARIRCEVPGPVSGAMLGSVSELANSGKFRINIDQKLPLAEVARAWELNRTGHTGGKIILEVSR